MFNRKNKDLLKPIIVRRNVDGKYAVRKPDAWGEPNKDYKYIVLYGMHNKTGMHRVDVLDTIMRNDWTYRGRPVDSDGTSFVWTNNLRALRKIVGYTEEEVV